MRVNCPECDFRVRVPDDDEDARVKCPECGERFRPSDLEDEEEEPRPKKGAKKKGTASRGQPAAGKGGVIALFAVLAGAGLLLIIGVGLAVYFFTNTPAEVKNPRPNLSPDTPQRLSPYVPPPTFPEPPRFVPDPNTPSTNLGPAPLTPPPKPVNPLDDLFSSSVDKPPLTTRVAVLGRKVNDAPLTVPTFHSLMVANKLVKPSPLTKLTLDEVKAATVYIKVEAGDLSGSGSGFYIGTEGGVALVATNHHVIEAATLKVPANAKKPKITCVFNSGLPADERSVTARIVGYDPFADVAVLRLDNPPAKMPKPINPWGTPKLTETMEVRICGFPFGEQLATATANPNISVNIGSVSSLRMNKGGGLDKVQINGAINPGNSGGPIVDKDGRLVGVAVSTIKGSGLGFAVPVDDLIALLEGKILFTEFLSVGVDKGMAKFKVVVPVMDPRGKVQTVYVRYWAGKGMKPQAVKDPQYGHKLIENGTEVVLKLPDGSSSLSVAVGDLILPADATEVVMQIGSEQVPTPGQQRGLITISAPVEYKLSVKDLATGADAKPLGDVFRDPASLAGQTVVARGKVVRRSSGYEGRDPLVLGDVTGRVPAGMNFMVDREVARQLDEIAPDMQGNDVRLVCVVGQKGVDGLVPVRVARIDFLDDVGIVVRTLPEADTTDPLMALNRDAKKFAGKTVTVTAAAALQPASPRPDGGFFVRFTNKGIPGLVQFSYTPGMMKKVSDLKLKPNGLYKVLLTGTVKLQGNVGIVSVTKVEILDPRDDSVQTTVE